MTTVRLVLLSALTIMGCLAACPNGLPDNIAQLMTNFAQSQFNQPYKWDCTLETQANKNATACSTTNSGASTGSLKFSLPKVSGTSGDTIVQNHFQNYQNSGAAKSTAQGTIGCSYAECDNRVDIVCLFKPFHQRHLLQIAVIPVVKSNNNAMLKGNMLGPLLFVVLFGLSRSAWSPEGSGDEVIIDGDEEAAASHQNRSLPSNGTSTSDDTDLLSDILNEPCHGTTLSIDQRNMVLQIHNDLRSSLARGHQMNLNGTMQSGRNIYKLAWDCGLERKIGDYIRFCNNSYMPGPQLRSDSMLYKTFWLYWDGWNHTQNIRKAMKHWWTEGRLKGNDDPRNRYISKKNFYAWANMAKGKTTKIGCSYQLCSKEKKAMFSCLYNVKAQSENEMIYEPGEPCQSNENCSTYPQSRCSLEDGLCLPPPDEPDDGENLLCPNNTKMTDASRIAALDLHNHYRSRLARGLEYNSETNTSQASAKRMLKMEYDCFLEEYAQNWAENCVFAHSDWSTRPNQGQNLYMTSFLWSDPLKLLHTGIEKWWQELEEVGIPGDNVLSHELWAKKGKAVGHWTQMAWDRTFRLGCSVVSCPDMGYLVCHYGPAGNRKGSLIYEMGTPCRTDSECPKGFACEISEGLCALIEEPY